MTLGVFFHDLIWGIRSECDSKVLDYLFIFPTLFDIKFGGSMSLLKVPLTPSEGKRLIGMSVAQMDAVQHALREGVIVVATCLLGSDMMA